MKKKSAVWVVFMMLLGFGYNAVAQMPDTIIIAPQKLWVTYSKTTNLVFPYAVRSIDRGSKDVLVQKAVGVENVLQLKAARPEFSETNLTVVTADGSFFSYLVNYAEAPADLTIKMLPPVTPVPVAVFTQEATTDVIGNYARIVNARMNTGRELKEKQNGIELALSAIYINADVFYFKLKLSNNTSVSYDVQQLRFFIRDRKRSKRTASQETEIVPLHVEGEAKRIPGKAEQGVTVAVPKFTIPDKKYFFIQLMEENGGRHLSLKVPGRRLLNATPIR